MKLRLAIVLAALALVGGPARAADADASGEMGRRVQLLLRAHAAEVFDCVRQERSDPKGEILLRLFVGDAGRIGKIDVLKETGTTSRLRGCLLEKVQAWNVSDLGASTGDQIVFPLVFAPGTPKATVSSWTVSSTHTSDCKIVRPRPEGEYAVVLLGASGGVVHFGTSSASADYAWLRPGDVFWTTGAPALDLCVADQKESPRFLVVASLNRATAGGVRKIIRRDEVAALRIAGGKGTVRLMLDGTGASFAVDLLSAGKGTEIPLHRHADSDEWVTITKGKATTLVAGRPQLASSVSAELYLPANEDHAMKVEETIEAVQVYAPAGPEQRFKQAAK